LPAEDENADFVMPAWIAGIRFARTLPEIHVDLDSSSPWWNDGIDCLCFNPDSAVGLKKEARRKPSAAKAMGLYL
jgi:hypothetical protein